MFTSIIMDGKHDIHCDDNDCADPRCVERRDECEQLLSKWRREGQDLAFVYHFTGEDGEEVAEFERLPNHREPLKVRMHGFTRNEIVLTNGESLTFLLPHVNVYSDDQVTFSAGKWNASLSPWSEEYAKKLAVRAKKK